MVSVREVDVFLVEDSSPLEGRAVETLAGGTVAIFRGQRPLTAQAVLHTTTVTPPLPLGFEILAFVMNAVGSSVLPLVLLAMSRRAGLMLVRLIGRLAALGFACAVRRHAAGLAY